MHTIACAGDDSQRTRTVAEAGASLSHAHEAPVLLAHVGDAMALAVPLRKQSRLAGTTPSHIADFDRRRTRVALDTTAEALMGIDYASRVMFPRV